MATKLPDISIEEFEGPFDLLIELAQQSKIDLSHVSLAQLTDAYLDVLAQQQHPAATQADFLVIAATLLLLKVRQLVPELSPDEELQIAELSDRVQIYQRYREQALRLAENWQPALLPGPALLTVDHAVPFPDIVPQDLWRALTGLIDRAIVPRPATRHLRVRGKTFQECLAFLQTQLAQHHSFIFQEALVGQSRDTTAVSFLAALELARQRQITLDQSQLFSPLKLTTGA